MKVSLAITEAHIFKGYCCLEKFYDSVNDLAPLPFETLAMMSV